MKNTHVHTAELKITLLNQNSAADYLSNQTEKCPAANLCKLGVFLFFYSHQSAGSAWRGVYGLWH